MSKCLYENVLITMSFNRADTEQKVRLSSIYGEFDDKEISPEA